ncbi:MAG: glutamyl-tRNA reductase [Terrimicrobiaceae bacterium]
MNIVCAGINHRSAPVDIREKYAVGPHELESALGRIRGIDGLAGAVIVSTCNRVEYYTASVCPIRVLDGLRSYLQERAGGGGAPLYTHESPASVRHLFRVASGLDSMVIGETEILGQIKQAYAAAAACGATTRHLNKLFQHAFRVAKQVRSETRITRGSTSVGSVAVDLAGKIFGDLKGRTIMMLGAGETGEKTSRSFLSRGVGSIIVTNRTFGRAARLAEEIGGMAVHFDNWHNAFDKVDILICSTAAPHPIVTREKLVPLLERRNDRPLFIIDLAVPRDAEASVNDLENVYLYDIDSLEQIVRESLEVRRAEVVRCEKMIDQHVGEFVGWMRDHISFLA